MTRPLSYLIAVVLAYATSTGPLQAVPITGGTGPGGVGVTTGASDGLKLWLQAESANVGVASGNTFTTWTDNSGSGNDVAAPGGLEPLFTTPGSGFNGHSVVRFDTTNYLEDTSFSGMANRSGATAFAILNTADQGGSRIGFVGEISASASSFPRVQHFTTGSPSEPRWLTGGASHVWRYGDGTSVVNALTTLYTSTFDGTQGDPEDRLGMRIDAIDYTPTIGSGGSVQTTTGSTGTVSVGRWVNATSTTNRWDGDFAEVVLFNTLLNQAEIQIVENYLSSKYDRSIAPAADHYAGDTSGNGDYDNDVFGVGRIDSSNLLENTGSSGFGIDAGGGSLGNGEWVLAGHKVDTNSLVAYGNGVRFDRVWYVDATKVDGVDTTLAFDFSDAGLTLPTLSGGTIEATLLYSPTDPFNFSAVGTFLEQSGDTFTFSLLNAQLLDGYFTLALQAVPEPSSSVLLGLGAVGLFGRKGRGRRRRCQNCHAERATR